MSDSPGMSPGSAVVVEIDVIAGMCPVQGDGTINGWPFYFRARGSEWCLSVAEPGMCPVGEPVWSEEDEYGEGPYDAGYMGVEEARGFIMGAAPRFAAWLAEHPEVDGGGRATALILKGQLKNSRQARGEEMRGRWAAEQEVVKLRQLLGMNPRPHPIAMTLLEGVRRDG